MDSCDRSWVQEARESLERSRVKLVLRRFGLEDWSARLLEEQDRLGGPPVLSFEAFDNLFPGFPICLEVLPLYRPGTRDRCSQTAMFRDFRQYTPYQQFLEIREGRACGRPIGILYRWPSLRDGLILHDGDFPTKNFKQIYTRGHERVTVEHFGRFLRTLAAIPMPLEVLLAPPANTPEPVPPWQPPTSWRLAQILPDRTELGVVAFLLEVLFHLPPEIAQRYVERRDGERWVVVAQQELAEKLGVDTRTIQRALVELKDKGLVETQRNAYGQNEMRVCIEALS